MSDDSWTINDVDLFLVFRQAQKSTLMRTLDQLDVSCSGRPALKACKYPYGPQGLLDFFPVVDVTHESMSICADYSPPLQVYIRSGISNSLKPPSTRCNQSMSRLLDSARRWFPQSDTVSSSCSNAVDLEDSNSTVSVARHGGLVYAAIERVSWRRQERLDQG